MLEKEGLTHAEFVKKTGKGTVTTYLEKNNLLDECIQWLNEKYKGESFWTKTGNNRTHVQYLEHVKRKREKGLGYWDDSPRFVGDTFAAVMKKTMMWAVHPEEDRFLNAREFAHLMGLPHDFEIDGEKSLNHIAQNVPTCTARDMAEQVKKFIRGELQMTKFSFLKQDNTNQTVVDAEEGFVTPVTEDQLNDVERNKMLLESLSLPLPFALLFLCLLFLFAFGEFLSESVAQRHDGSCDCQLLVLGFWLLVLDHMSRRKTYGLRVASASLLS